MLWTKAVDHNNYKAVLRAYQAPSDIRSTTPCWCVATISLRLSIVNSVDNAVSFSILTIHLTPAVEFPCRVACSLQFTHHEQIVAHSDVSTALGNLCQIIRHCFLNFFPHFYSGWIFLTRISGHFQPPMFDHFYQINPIRFQMSPLSLFSIIPFITT